MLGGTALGEQDGGQVSHSHCMGALMAGTFRSLFLPVWDPKVKVEAGYGWWLEHGAGGGMDAGRYFQLTHCT